MQKPHAQIGHGLADSVGVTWLIDNYDGTRVIKHGGSINGHMSEFLLVPDRGFGVTVLTNGQRGHELGSEVLAWCLRELLGPEPSGTGVHAAQPTRRRTTTSAATR